VIWGENCAVKGVLQSCGKDEGEYYGYGYVVKAVAVDAGVGGMARTG